jgi:hypothetical protein
MSIKTLRKRIALVAVSALGVGLLSVAPASSSVTSAITDMNIYANAAAGGIYVNDTTEANNKSQGLVANPTAAANGTGLNQTAALYSNGVITVATNDAATAMKIEISGGTLVSAADCKKTGGTLAVAADLTSCTLTANASNQLFASIKPNAAGTALVITGYDNSGAAANWKITVTVVAAGSSGTFSASKSNIALTAGGGAPSTANVDTVGANVAENAACVELYYALNDALGLPLSGASVIAKASNSGMALTIGGTTDTLPVDTGTYSSATYVSACQNAANANKPLSGTLTLTVNGVDVATRDILIVGQLASITVVEVATAVRGDDGGAADNDYYGDFATRNAGTWYPSHTYTGKDSAGNLVPVDVVIEATTLNAQVTSLADDGTADPRNADSDLRTGGLTFACANATGSNTGVKVKATAADTSTITSNAFTVKCAGDPVNYKASLDKQVYKTGEVMTVTVDFTDATGAPANDYALISKASYVGTIASGAIASNVKVPASAAAGEAASGGKATYKYIIGQTAGDFTVAIDFPNVNNTTYSQAAITVPVKVQNSVEVVTDAEVLASIVKLIASINKQIRALQKSLRR